MICTLQKNLPVPYMYMCDLYAVCRCINVYISILKFYSHCSELEIIKRIQVIQLIGIKSQMKFLEIFTC